MKKLFLVAISMDEKSGRFRATVDSLIDRKTVTFEEKSATKLTQRLNRLVKQKIKEVRTLPIPEESRILIPGGRQRLNGKVIVPVPALN